jgi:sugar fermentation stimulation protein A
VNGPLGLTWPPHELEQATLERRYKRFLADIRFEDGSIETVHCPNSGSMLGMKDPGSPVVVSDSDNPKRRLRKTLELIQVDDGAGPTWVGVNTMRPNHWAAEMIEAGQLPGIPPGVSIQREVSLDGGRIDLLLRTPRGKRVWVEVKNTTLAGTGPDGTLEARFPDAVTERGRRHLDVLTQQVEKGDKAVILFLVNRGDTKRFRAAAEIDPEYANALKQAREAGVRPVAMQVRHRLINGSQGPKVQTEVGGAVPVARNLLWATR